MKIRHKVFRNLYQDSVSLMQISALINKMPGIDQASVVMGTETNLLQLQDAQLDEGISAGPNDLIIAVRGEEEACEQALAVAENKLTSKPEADNQAGVKKQPYTSLEMALTAAPTANCALISVPGDYAAAEAVKALHLGLNVMLFSDNVSAEHELMIKKLAFEKKLLVMGPDCGTAIINGVPLGFANKVAAGNIGIVAASGTGLQEVSCRIDQLGEGISQALGTGGHDLSQEIAGRSMLFSLSLLAQDPNTQVVVLISKPPAAAVAETILSQAQSIKKPVVVHFLGAKEEQVAMAGITYAATLTDAAEQAVALARTGKKKPFANEIDEQSKNRLKTAAGSLDAGRRYIRGVFAGGTFCYESQLICSEQGIQAYSNTPVQGNQKIKDIWQSQQHTLIDMGDDDFTRGKPHPMIDPTQRNKRIYSEIKDSQTAIVLFDLVLGYGAALDPSGELLEIIKQAKAQCSSEPPVLLAHVCGTEADIQVRSKQIAALEQAGVIVAGCNAQAALWTAFIANQCSVK